MTTAEKLSIEIKSSNPEFLGYMVQVIFIQTRAIGLQKSKV